MDAAPYSAHTVYAEVLFMTPPELVEFFDLIRAERVREISEAQQRIVEKLKRRYARSAANHPCQTPKAQRSR